jgi:hypothetical protein
MSEIGDPGDERRPARSHLLGLLEASPLPQFVLDGTVVHLNPDTRVLTLNSSPSPSRPVVPLPIPVKGAGHTVSGAAYPDGRWLVTRLVPDHQL